jgi:hypothetical protein
MNQERLLVKQFYRKTLKQLQSLNFPSYPIAFQIKTLIYFQSKYGPKRLVISLIDQAERDVAVLFQGLKKENPFVLSKSQQQIDISMCKKQENEMIAKDNKIDETLSKGKKNDVKTYRKWLPGFVQVRTS